MFSWWEPSLRSGNFGHLCSLCKLSLSVSLSISQHQHLCILYEPAPGTSKSWPVWQVSSVVCQFQVRNFFRFFSIDQFTDLTNDQGHQGQTMQTANCSVYVGNSANWLPQLPKLPEKLCLGMDSLKFTCISLHFIAFHCISLHFNAFHCISLHFIAFHCISICLRMVLFMDFNFFPYWSIPCLAGLDARLYGVQNEWLYQLNPLLQYPRFTNHRNDVISGLFSGYTPATNTASCLP